MENGTSNERLPRQACQQVMMVLFKTRLTLMLLFKDTCKSRDLLFCCISLLPRLNRYDAAAYRRQEDKADYPGGVSS